jgi:hypothetical protein
MCFLYSKPTHALLLNTLSHPRFKTLELKKSFVKIIKNPTCFGHYHMTILRGRLLYFVPYYFACLLRHLHYSVCGCNVMFALENNAMVLFTKIWRRLKHVTEKLDLTMWVYARGTCLWVVWSWTVSYCMW